MRNFLALGVLLCAATAANAGITVTYDGAPSLAGGVYTYGYSVSQTADDQIRTNDFFTLYDFNGLIGVGGPNAPTGPTGWAASTQTVGVSPAPWVRFTFIGAGPLTSNLISGFSVSSTVGPDAVPNLTWAGTNFSGQSLPQQAQGGTFGPLQQETVPEPATMSLMGGALLGLGLLASRRK